ncbi:hypothetical protein CEXT_391991 [Caerostris extrusa]|uniref:MPN domain-containing protein n=1 Tax=Caerostris extrusa TaxID=172846 RepID=A0AAV4PCJ0_CAEEX|nr:hypothetical protein CEXT_391991 [Caerostris extrusa]
MTVKQVNLSTDVYFVCLNHAMSTDGEEIVGLLVGEVDENRVAHVSAVVLLRRSDKRKDRVEISPEQLSSASTEAERLACILKRPIRVIGWYHSHPKLTVWPSPIDVNTQDNYQFMDEGFIGMIFSVFNDDPNKKTNIEHRSRISMYRALELFGGRIQMTCFQAQSILLDDCNIDKKRVDIPIHLVPASSISSVCMNALIQLPRFLCQEEQLAYQITNQVPLDYLTRLHNSSVYVKSMGRIAEVICGPLLKMLEERIINNEFKRKKLLERKRELKSCLEQMQKEIEKMKEQEKNKVLQPSTNSSCDAVVKSLEENKEILQKNYVESDLHLQSKIDTSQCLEATCSQSETETHTSLSIEVACEAAEKHPGINNGVQLPKNSFTKRKGDTTTPVLIKLERYFPKEISTKEESHSQVVTPNSPQNEMEDVHNEKKVTAKENQQM